MKSLTCFEARAVFSEHQDRRLAAPSRALLEAHLEACVGCRSGWRIYSTTFDLVGHMRELPSKRAFLKPKEAPGLFDRERKRFLSMPRLRAAAGVLLILGVSHIVVFEWARRGQGLTEMFTPDAGARDAAERASGRTGPPVLEAGFLPARMRDHLDAADVLTRQIAHMPPDAGEECRQLVDAQLDVLTPDRLLADTQVNSLKLGPAGASYQNYLLAWQKFQRNVRSQIWAHGTTEVVGWLQDELERSGVTDPMVAARAHVIREPMGGTWGDVDLLARGRLRGTNCDDLPVDVRSFLSAQGNVLRAQYDSAQEGFRGVRQSRRASRLQPLAAYMEAECLRRVGAYDRAIELVLLNGAYQLRCPKIVRRDPLTLQVMMFSNSQAGLWANPASPTIMFVPNFIDTLMRPQAWVQTDPFGRRMVFEIQRLQVPIPDEALPATGYEMAVPPLQTVPLQSGR